MIDEKFVLLKFTIQYSVLKLKGLFICPEANVRTVSRDSLDTNNNTQVLQHHQAERPVEVFIETNTKEPRSVTNLVTAEL